MRSGQFVDERENSCLSALHIRLRGHTPTPSSRNHEQIAEPGMLPDRAGVFTMDTIGRTQVWFWDGICCWGDDVLEVGVCARCVAGRWMTQSGHSPRHLSFLLFFFCLLLAGPVWFIWFATSLHSCCLCRSTHVFLGAALRMGWEGLGCR